MSSTTGTERIAAERQRQIDTEGYTPSHDAEHDAGDLMRAARAYLRHAEGYTHNFASRSWPWEPRTFKPTTPGRDLEKAGALIAAAIDRLAVAR